MEITTTTVTRAARHVTATGIFNIEYSTTNERLNHIQINLVRPAGEGETEEFLGTVHYDGHNISCHLRMEEDLANLFETAAGFVAEIIESIGQNAEDVTPDNNKQR